ncbi:MAG: phosphatidylglycerol---prolipoprotein diacylglyceryl transferase [Phycisphaerales bacterium]|jgi:phosphatidylglycerol:prolipoprotein diacylglycerol transferase|nr:phosphatidylglycerol---prolipoprotein diacylglyceryl transferase [Phycisphaerales bacterium]
MTAHLAYSLFMVLAIAALLIARRAQPDPQIGVIDRKHRLLLTWAAFLGAGLGAKLPFVFTAGPGQWFELHAWLSDGKTILAGIAGGYLAVEIAKKILGVRVKTGDAVAFPAAVCVAVGRWGCFFNGCCFGTETHVPWAVDFGGGIRRHPTQVYESLFHLAMAIVLWQLLRRGLLRRQRLKFYLIAYCIFRFATEFIRPEPRIIGGLTAYQWGAIVIASALAVQWVFDQRALQAQRGMLAVFDESSEPIASAAH